MKDSGRQKDRQRWERKEWASLVEKHPCRVKASPWGAVETGDHWLLHDLVERGVNGGGSVEQGTEVFPAPCADAALLFDQG